MKTLHSPSPKTRRWLCAAAVGLAAVAVPASASAATPSNPRVAQINPTTGTVTSLAGGAPWTKLGGIAISPTGTLYVANQGPLGPSPRGAGIYSLTAPGFAITPVASTPFPMSVVASGSSLYALDTDRVLSLTGSAPTVVSSGGLYDTYDVVPEFGAVAGNTMYTTASSSCDQAEGGGSYVIAVNLTTGAQTLTKNFGCTPISGIAATPGGELLVAQPGKIAELDPYTGVTGTLTSGGQLTTPQGIALNPAGDLLVADSTSGVIAVDPETGDQSPVTTPGAVAGASGITVGQDGTIYVTEAGLPPTLRASAAHRQHFSGAGIAFTAACSRTCKLGYSTQVRIAGKPGYARYRVFATVTGRRHLHAKLPSRVNHHIRTALRHGKKVGVTLQLKPMDHNSGASGKSTTLRVRLTRS